MDFKQWLYQEVVGLEFFETPQAIDYLVKQSFGWMDWSGGDGDEFRYQAKIDLYGDAYPDEEDKDSIEEKAVEIAKEYLTDRLYDVLFQYRRFGDPIRLFREITVPGKGKNEVIRNIRLIHLGPYWAHTENAAEAHWGNFSLGYVKVVLYAEVPSQNVNWEHTLIKNIIPSYTEEKEVELKETLSIKIKKIKIAGGKWQDVNLTGFV